MGLSKLERRRRIKKRIRKTITGTADIPRLSIFRSNTEFYAQVTEYINTWYGQIALLAFAFSLYYHLGNGIRHLFWDAGIGLEIETTYKSGYAVILSSVILTALSCYLASCAS